MAASMLTELSPSLNYVDLTSNVCIDEKFNGNSELPRLIAAVESNCDYEKPKNNANELFCERIYRCEYGICCDIRYETNITSPDCEIVSTDHARIQSLEIKQHHDYGANDHWTYINFLPLVNNFTRNLIHYKVQRTSIKTIGEENFHGMIWLERLDLLSNSIETIAKDTFQGLFSLKFMDLGERKNGRHKHFQKNLFQ